MARADGSILFRGLRLNRSGHLAEAGELFACRNLLADSGALRRRAGLSASFSPAPSDSDYWQRGLALYQNARDSVNIAIGQRLTAAAEGDPETTRQDA